MGGFAVSFNEVNDETREDLTRAELIAFPILTILLLLVFRGAVAAAIPLLLGIFSILGTFLVLRVMSGVVDTSLFALNLATALSLGLAVDYGLLLVSRYREELERAGGVATEEAHRRMVLTAGRTVLFSGFTVATALAALMLMPQRFLYSIGAAGAAVGLLSALIAILVVPSMLALLGTRINALAIRRGPAVSEHSNGWYRLAKAVMRRPLVVALGCTALLLALSSPLLGDGLDRAERGGRAAEPAVLRRQQVHRRELLARLAFPVIGARVAAADGRAARRSCSRSCTRRIAALDGIDGRGAVPARVAARSRTRPSRRPGRRSTTASRTRCRRSAHRDAPAAARCSCPATPRASSTRRRA